MFVAMEYAAAAKPAAPVLLIAEPAEAGGAEAQRFRFPVWPAPIPRTQSKKSHSRPRPPAEWVHILIPGRATARALPSIAKKLSAQPALTSPIYRSLPVQNQPPPLAR